MKKLLPILLLCVVALALTTEGGCISEDDGAAGDGFSKGVCGEGYEVCDQGGY